MKKLLIAAFLLILNVSLYSQSHKDTQVLQSGHWIYSDLYTLSTEAQKSYFIDSQPLTIGELKFYFSEIEYDSLSQSGKTLYNKIQSFFDKEEDFVKDPTLRFFVNPKFNAELFYKSNPQIPYSFDYAIKDRAFTAPFIFGFSNYITIETDPYIGKNYGSSKAHENFTNIPYSFDHMDAHLPEFAYGATGFATDNWGVNFHMAKDGLTIGDTILGSIIYNKTFDTDFYAQLNFYTRLLKYSCDVIQVTTNKYIYLHQMNVRPLKNLKVGFMEGTLLNAPFELRFLNPLYVMHSFIGWKDYNLTDLEWKYYNEGHFGAYLCFNAEYMPLPNLRIYGYFSQNELLDPGWEHSEKDLSYPDSIGLQFGTEYIFGFADGSRLKNTLEASYTSPYLYVKQSPDWSFWNKQREEISGAKICSWMGSPFGPDCFAVEYKASFESIQNFTISASYLFKIHGENNFSMFKTKKIKNKAGEEETIYIYYPYAEYQDATTDEGRKAAVKKSRNMWMTGIKEYTNQFCISATYNVSEKFNIYSQGLFTFIYNNNNISNNFQSGFEIGLGCEYKIF